MKINIHQVDAFTTEKFGGNPAGVVSDANGLSDTVMQQIAREMNLSETAFVLDTTEADATLRLRYFTPTAEVDFCGHATVGALFQLAKLHRFGLGSQGTNEVQVETNIGILPMTVINEKEMQPRVAFTAPAVHMEPYRAQGESFAQEFGVVAELIAADSMIFLDTVLNYVYIPVHSLELLQQQVFNFARIRERSGDEKIIVFCFYAKGNGDTNFDLHARGLAPNVGVDEDPFTGSMQAGLITAAKQSHFIDSSQLEVRVTQGQAIGRPGSALVTHDLLTNKIAVTANAVQVFSAQMEV